MVFNVHGILSRVSGGIMVSHNVPVASNLYGRCLVMSPVSIEKGYSSCQFPRLTAFCGSLLVTAQDATALTLGTMLSALYKGVPGLQHHL